METPALRNRLQHQVDRSRTLIKTPSLPPKKQEPPNAKVKGDARSWLLLITLILTFGLIWLYYLLSTVVRPQSPLLLGRAIPSRNLVDTKNHSQNVSLAIRHLSFSDRDEILPPLRDITLKLSQSIDLVDQLDFLASGRLTYSIKTAVSTKKCLYFSRVQPFVYLAQNHSDKII